MLALFSQTFLIKVGFTDICLHKVWRQRPISLAGDAPSGTQVSAIDIVHEVPVRLLRLAVLTPSVGLKSFKCHVAVCGLCDVPA